MLTGKCRKLRHVPLGGNIVALLASYLAEHGLDHPCHGGQLLFVNQHGNSSARIVGLDDAKCSEWRR